MKEKKWIDCPSCGSKGTMKYYKNKSEKYTALGYKPIVITGLDGYFCSSCDEGVFTIKSAKRINAMMAEEKARQDSSRIVATEIVDVETVAKKLEITRQRVHQMMIEGKLSYVFVGRKRYPIKKNEPFIKGLKKRIRAESLKKGHNG
jgi:YgiT-type zinc finger domain-containing protein